MEGFAQSYIRFLLGVALGGLFIWIGVTGRLGSLLGAMITPGNMVEGTPASINNPGGQGNQSTGNKSAKKLTDVQIAQYAGDAGLSSYNYLSTAVAVAIAESQGDTNAHNPGSATDIEDSYGLWQINVLAHPSYSKTQLYDPAYNAGAMYAISRGGTNWNPWGTYTSGEYKQYISRGNAAAFIVVGGI